MRWSTRPNDTRGIFFSKGYIHFIIIITWTCVFFFFGLLFLRGLWASELELKLLLWAFLEFEDPLALNEDPLMLFDVLLDVDILALCFEEFLLDEGPNFDLARTDDERGLADGRGGGIKALADICLYTNRINWAKIEMHVSFST